MLNFRKALLNLLSAGQSAAQGRPNRSVSRRKPFSTLLVPVRYGVQRQNPRVKETTSGTSESSSSKNRNRTQESINLAISFLCLAYLICVPLGIIPETHKFKIQDFGVVLVLVAINSGKIDQIKKISEDGIEFWEEKMNKVFDEKADLRDAQDQEAIRCVDLQLSESTSTGITDKVLRDKISKVSATATEYIYYLAKDVRHRAWLNKQDNKPKHGLIDRTIPVFEALVFTKSGENCHRFYAQLGYALKDQEVPDWEQAKVNLEKAIQLWQKQNPDTALPSVYCFNWLLCIAELDTRGSYFRQYTESEKEVITQRLNAAVGCDRLAKAFREEKSFPGWLQQNQGWLNPEIYQYLQKSDPNSEDQTQSALLSTCSRVA